MAIATPTLLTSGTDEDGGATATTASVTLTTGRLYCIQVLGRRGDSVSIVAPTSVVRGAQSFAIVDATKGFIAHDTTSSSRRGIWVGYCIPASDTTGTIVITFASNHTDILWNVVEVASGFDSSGTIVQVQSGKDETVGGTNFEITFGSSIGSGNAVIGFFADAGAGGLTPGAGYTELAETNTADSGGAIAVAYNLAPDTTFDYTHANTEEVGAIAVEIKAAAAAADPEGRLKGGKLIRGGLLRGGVL